MSSATAVLVGIIGEDRYGASCLAAGSEAELEWSGVEYGFLGLFEEGGGREGGGVRSVSLWLEDPEEV